MTIKVKTDLNEINFDLAGFLSDFDDFMVRKTKEAARSWLTTVLGIIPTWSRASRATFEALAGEVGFNVTYGPQRSVEDRLTLGLSTGSGGLDVSNLKSYHFFYETNLRYLAFNEMNHAVRGEGGVFAGLINDTPYRFREAGRADFQSFASSFVKLPSISPYISPKKI